MPRAALAAEDLGFAGCNAKPTKSNTAEAKRSYERGKKLFDERDPGAIDLFRSAYLADCTKHELLVVLSFAYQSDGQLKKALAASELYLQRRGSSLAADDRRTVEERVALLKQKQKEQEDAAAEAARPKLQVAPSARVQAPPPAAPVAHRSPYPWVLVGVGAAAIVTGSILIPVGSAKYSDLACRDATLFKNGKCQSIDGREGPQSLALGKEAGAAMGLKRAGVLTITAGSAAAVVGLLWLVFDVTSKPVTTGVRVVPTFSPNSLGLAGTF